MAANTAYVRRTAAEKALAQERALRFREPRYSRTSRALIGFKIVTVTGERHRRNLIERGARPQLTSSEWRAIQKEVAERGNA